METIIGVAIIAAAILALWVLKPERTRAALGIVTINDFTVEKVRQAIIKACEAAPIAGLSREKAQDLLREVARHAICHTFAGIYPGRPFEVTDRWPDATVIISGNIAVIDAWIGHDYMSDGEGVKPVNVAVNRAPVLKLDKRKPINVVLDEVFAAPPKSEKPESAQSSKPVPKAFPKGVKR